LATQPDGNQLPGGSNKVKRKLRPETGIPPCQPPSPTPETAGATRSQLPVAGGSHISRFTPACSWPSPRYARRKEAL